MIIEVTNMYTDIIYSIILYKRGFFLHVMQNRSSIVGRQKLGPRLWPDKKETLAKARSENLAKIAKDIPYL